MSSSTKTALCIQLKDKIELTDQEKKIFDRLLRVVDHQSLLTQLRVAGGWVRDKLLGKESNEIDIALDNLKGDDFCDMVNEYLYSLGENKRWVGVIKSNPEKCKNFTTGIMKLTRVRDAMKNKISKDRIGDEINLIVPGNRPVQAMMDPNVSDRHCVAYQIGFSSIHDMQRGLYLHSALLLPIRGKGTGTPNVGRLHRASEGFKSLIPLLTESSNTGKATGKVSEKTANLRVQTGLVLQDINIKGKKDAESFSWWRLENMCEIPLADGKEIMEMLGIKEGGKIVGRWKHELLVWQLADPTRTLEQSLDWMRGCLSKR
ncbi:hypothetical protein MKX03_030799 [Papaver bracteatum]|nr:hypothetical protein MKX03_030799 [Papaver bracteatum]